MDTDEPASAVPPQHHDPDYTRPIRARYVDPVEVIWLATATRLGLTIRRNPDIFSMTDGTGLLALGPRKDLDEDDCLTQMLFHEICHWITNGRETFHERDWGFPLWGPLDVREHASLRLQAWWSGRHGLRAQFGPTGLFRQYYDRIPADPFAPIDDTQWEADVIATARQAIARAQGEPWWQPIEAAMAATRAIQLAIAPFADDYRSEHAEDPLPLLWTRTDSSAP
ncbi:MAG: hypothetical protein ACI8RZ_000546 [Myxococcota bacterium]|jgi:hypothetical protein